MLTPRRRLSVLAALALAVGLVATARDAAAEPVARRSYHGTVAAPYRFEIEPHFSFGPPDPPGPGGGSGAGAGVRASVILAPEGFIRGVDDSVAIGFGIDVLRYAGNGDRFGSCVRHASAPAGTSVCTEVDTPGAPHGYFVLPVVMQWNFRLSPLFSVFGEPGLAVFAASGGGGIAPALFLGGRFHVTDTLAVTLRIGWPLVTIGGSFMM